MKFEEWLETSQAWKLMDALGGRLRSVAYVFDLPSGQNGAYIHPALVPHLIAWASPSLGIRLSSVLNSSAVEGVEEMFRRALAETDESAKRALLERDAALDKIRGLEERHRADMEALRRGAGPEYSVLGVESQALISLFKSYTGAISPTLSGTATRGGQ